MDRINELFNNLDEWRHLPSYQLERRADVFFSIYIKTLVQKKFGVEIKHVIPEFPVRIGTIYPEIDINKSFKIDYFTITQDGRNVIFVELKTDTASIRENQDKYLQSAKDAGLINLLEGILEIYRKTKAKKKYLCLLNKIESIGLIHSMSDGSYDVVNAQYLIDLMYIQPNNENRQEKVLTFYEAAEIVEQYNDDLSKRFAQSLREWATVNAGDCSSY